MEDCSRACCAKTCRCEPPADAGEPKTCLAAFEEAAYVRAERIGKMLSDELADEC